MKVFKYYVKKHNVTIDFNIKVGYPCLVNDKNLTNSAIKLAQFIGRHNVVELPVRMTAEDFHIIQKKYLLVLSWVQEISKRILNMVYTLQDLISMKDH